MRLLLIRHGDPDYPNNTLTPRGHLEARALAKRLGNHGLTHIFSSPLGRAKDTAGYTCETTGLAMEILDWTREIEGMSVDQPEPYGRGALWDLHGSRVKSLGPYPSSEDWFTIPPFDQQITRQTWDGIAKESDSFLAGLGFSHTGRGIYAVDPDPGVRRNCVALFAHGGFGLTWLAYLLGIPLPEIWAGFFLFPSSVTTILMDEREPGLAVPRCIGLGDVSHLYAEGLEPSPRGIKANSV